MKCFSTCSKGNTHLATDDMCDLHEMVIHHVCKMIRRIPISLHENKILLGLLLLKGPVDGVLEPRRPETARVETNNVSLAGRSPGIRLGPGNGAARPRVGGGLAGVVKGALLRFQNFRVAETAVGGTVVY